MFLELIIIATNIQFILWLVVKHLIGILNNDVSFPSFSTFVFSERWCQVYLLRNLRIEM